MRSLGDVLAMNRHHHHARRQYRRDAVFVRDLASVSTRLDRNQRARLLALAEGIERRTKAPGKQSGILGQTGLAVLRSLVLHFQCRTTGLCFPSIKKIRAVTGFCKQTVVKALRALETIGILRVTRRLVRREIERGGTAMVTTVQGSNVYAFKLDGQIVIRPLLGCVARSFPKPNALMALLFQPGLRNRLNPHHTSSKAQQTREERGSAG
jgi:hypothetical protein